MIIFHKQVKQWKDDWYEHLPQVIWRGPTGTLLTVVIIVFGAVSIFIGVRGFYSRLFNNENDLLQNSKSNEGFLTVGDQLRVRFVDLKDEHVNHL